MEPKRGIRGLSLIEVTLALSLLSLLIVALLGSVVILSRRGIARVDNRARANALAVRLLEDQRAKVRASSFADLVETDSHLVRAPVIVPVDLAALGSPKTVEGVPYTASVTLTPGSVLSGAFDPTVPLEGSETVGGVPQDPAGSGKVAHYAAALVTVKVDWPGGSITRESIIVPR
ncbi:MAG: hypothetical protein ACM3X6_01940 [Patescibacteria group bacterium]